MASELNAPAVPVEDADVGSAASDPATSAQTATPQTAIQRFFGSLDDLARIRARGCPPRGMRRKRRNWARLVVLPSSPAVRLNSPPVSPDSAVPVPVTQGISLSSVVQIGERELRPRGRRSRRIFVNSMSDLFHHDVALKPAEDSLEPFICNPALHQQPGWPAHREASPVAEWPSTAPNHGEFRVPSCSIPPSRETAPPRWRW